MKVSIEAIRRRDADCVEFRFVVPRSFSGEDLAREVGEAKQLIVVATRPGKAPRVFDCSGPESMARTLALVAALVADEEAMGREGERLDVPL